jgi:hypothetical protein
MSYPKTKEEYWDLIDLHWMNLQEIFWLYLPMSEAVDYRKQPIDRRMCIEVNRLRDERSDILPRYFHAAWAAAPDSFHIHSIPSWGVLCDLCSEEYVLHEQDEEVTFFEALGIHRQAFGEARKILKEITDYNAKQVDPDDCHSAAEILTDLVNNPHYYATEGGEEGSVGRNLYIRTYGMLPSLKELALELS